VTRMAAPLRFGIWLDFRNPARWHTDPRRLWAATIELAVHAERIGFDEVWTSEHHFVEDGYLAGSFPACAAIAARTSRIRIGTNVVLLPLHNPLRVAEDAAAVDLISGGRFDLGVAVGYRGAEFEAFGLDPGTRGARMETSVARLVEAFGGRPLTPHVAGPAGQLRLSPGPLQDPMPLWIGAMSTAAAVRAGRYGTGLLGPELLAPDLDSERTVDLVVETFRAGQIARGRNAPFDIALGPGFGYIAEDPDREASTVLPHLIYRRALYQHWFAEAQVEGEPTAKPFEEHRFRELLPWILVAPEVAVSRIRSILARYPETSDLYFWAVPPGIPIESAVSSIELFAERVIPEFR
jgi:alkanesulfonate monooxygenase SsuD/methylene tetrahydromethanopterin reductase-like flavin-dependent oxidoreductase (luciferase family)